ncbi:hypothetical protein RUND412_003880 [Rhizina undulata]
MKLAAFFVMTTLAIAGSAVAAVGPRVAYGQYENTPNLWIVPEYKYYSPYYNYDKSYAEWEKKDKELRQYDQSQNTYDTHDDIYAKTDYDAYYDTDLYKQEAGVGRGDIEYECCYGYDKGAKYDKGYGYSKGYIKEYDTETDVKAADEHGQEEYDKEEAAKEHKYYSDDDKSKDLYEKEQENWKKLNDFRAQPFYYRQW